MMNCRVCFSVRLLVLVGYFLIVTRVAGAPPKLNYLFPAGAQRGQTVQVTANGTFSNWPVTAWVDRDGVKVEADTKKGNLNITLQPDAPAGTYWLRLYDQEGATTLRPFIASVLPEIIEKEPNDDSTKPQPLAASSVVNGKLATGGDVDGFSIKLEQGQTLVASMTANEVLGSPMDGVLQICSLDGLVMKQNDEGRGFDPQIVFQAPHDGSYVVRTFAFPATPNSTIGFSGADTYVYRLTVTTGGFVDHAFPMSLGNAASTDIQLFGWNIPDSAGKQPILRDVDRELTTVFHPSLAGTLELPTRSHRNILAKDDSSPETPQPIELPSTITGRIEAPHDVDAFIFSAKKGQKLSFRVESRSLGYPLDPLLQLQDAAGKVLVEVDDVSKKPDPTITRTISADGQYRLQIRDLHRQGGFRYVYRLTADELVPDYSLTLAADSFVLTPGKPLEIPVTIERKNGFADEIEIVAVGLPDGVNAAAAKSMPKGDSAKTVKLKLTADKGLSNGPIRIVGRVAGNEKLNRTATFPVLNVSHRDAWLTVAGK